MEKYLPLLKDQKVAIVGNQSSMVEGTHLVDTLLQSGIEVVKVFSPEHGFRGKADAGEHVNSSIDEKTNLPLVSLYGSNKKPKPEQLAGVDVLLFDLQDVGVRFYTYISTLHYVMEACAEQSVPLIVLDRPNPNGHYVDGPVLDMEFKSFVGMHPVPVVYGMTIGEYAQMINGEKWLKNGVQCDLNVITLAGWNHKKHYKLPIKPSPNLPNMTAIYLYPSLCFFEGTVVSVGRGTEYPFQVVGHPNFTSESTFVFKPESTEGAKHPKLEGEACFGVDFRKLGVDALQVQNKLQLKWLLLFYQTLDLKEQFFLKNHFIDLLAGTNQLRLDILAGLSENEIRDKWQVKLEEFKQIRQTYLLYEDF